MFGRVRTILVQRPTLSLTSSDQARNSSEDLWTSLRSPFRWPRFSTSTELQNGNLEDLVMFRTVTIFSIIFKLKLFADKNPTTVFESLTWAASLGSVLTGGKRLAYRNLRRLESVNLGPRWSSIKKIMER